MRDPLESAAGSCSDPPPAPNAANSFLFGYDVRVSGDGLQVVVMSRGEASALPGVSATAGSGTGANNSGAAYRFTRSAVGAPFVFTNFIKGATARSLFVPNSPSAASNADHGDELSSLAVSRSGTSLFLGAPREDSAAAGVNGDQLDNSASSSGAAYLFDIPAPPPSCPLASCQCVAAVCTVTGDATVSTVVDLGTLNVTITGNLVVESAGALVVAEGGAVNVQGTTTLSGTLVYSLTSSSPPVTVAVLSAAGGYSGQFNNVTVTGSTGQACEALVGAPDYGTHPQLLSMLVTLDSSACTGGGGLHPGAIAGIAVGGAVAVGVVVVVVYVCKKKRSRAAMQARIERANELAMNPDEQAR